MVARRGRPPKFEEPEKDDLVKKFEDYVEKTDLPIVSEFAAQNGLYRQYLHDHDEFTDIIKRCLTKKEAALERGALTNQLNPTMAIFSLKQRWHGWRDKEEKMSLNLDDITPEQAKAILDLYTKGE